MGTSTRGVSVSAIVLILATWSCTVRAESIGSDPAGAAVMAPDARVRGVSTRIVGAITEAGARSATFRDLVARIDATDGIVYVAEGECGHEVRACLLTGMTVMGANRVLWIRVDPRKVDRELMGSIAHELQHAYEVLSYRNIRDEYAMTMLFRRIGSKSRDRFETDAAIDTGNTVRVELGRNRKP
jgi:hypothetical protein